MLIFIYHVLFTIILVVSLPIASLLRNRRLSERLALRLPYISKVNGVLWVHALSVGEVISAIPLIKTLTLKFPRYEIILTVTTVKGMQIAKSNLTGQVKALLTMPIDCWWSFRRLTKLIRPSMFLLVETDIWPGLLEYLKNKGTKTILINGRISPHTFKQYRRFPLFVRMAIEPLDLCLMQNDLDRNRLLRTGIGNPNKVKTVGNIKYDREWVPLSQKEHQGWIKCFNIRPEDLIWVAGSTHRGEEAVLLKVYKVLNHEFPSLRLILAPRRIEQSDMVLRLSEEMGLKGCLKTNLSKDKGRCHVIILNTLGELNRIYGLGHVSFVGGSLVPFGGHNLLEPASFGCPVVFGYHTHNFVFMSNSLIEAGGGFRVRDGNELYETMKMLLGNSEMRALMGKRAKAFSEKNHGALERVVEYIADLMGETEVRR